MAGEEVHSNHDLTIGETNQFAQAWKVGGKVGFDYCLIK